MAGNESLRSRSDIAFMEAIVMPVTWEQWPHAARGIFGGFRSDAREAMVIEKNLFVEADRGAIVIGEVRDTPVGVPPAG